MIHINDKIFYTAILVSLVVIASFTTLYIDVEKNNFDSQNYTHRNRSEDLYMNYYGEEKGYFKRKLCKGFEPGVYKVTIHPVGNRNTIKIVSEYSDISLYINETYTVELKIDNYVWLSGIVEDVPRTEPGNMKKNQIIFDFKKVDHTIKPTTIALWTITAGGGVLYAVRFYRRERE